MFQTTQDARWTLPGSESPVFPWERLLGGWRLEPLPPIGKGAFGSVYACRRGDESAACKVVPVTTKSADEMRAEIGRQSACARFAPAVLHARVEPPWAVVVMERFPLCVHRLVRAMFERLGGERFLRALAELIPRLLEQVDGFAGPEPGRQFIHGDLSIQNVLLRFYDAASLDAALAAPRLPGFRLVACDFGYSTMYASGLACDPILARNEMRRAAVFVPGYDRAFFVASLVGAAARWTERTCGDAIREICKCAPELSIVFHETRRIAKVYSAGWKWQEHAMWEPEFLDARGITCAGARRQ